MKIFILFALLISVIHTENLPPLPGLDKVGLGYDVVYGTFRASVLGWTFTQNKTWTNPNYPTLVYSVPDQINVITFPESSIVKEQVTVITKNFFDPFNSPNQHNNMLNLCL